MYIHIYVSREIHGFAWLWKNIFLSLFLPGLGLCCSICTFSSCGEPGCYLVVVRGLLVAVASSLFLFFFCRMQPLVMWASVVAVPRLNCPAARGILVPDQGSNLCLLQWSVPGPPGKSQTFFFLIPTSSVLSWSSFLVSTHSTYFKCCKICKYGDVQWFDHSSGSFFYLFI